MTAVITSRRRLALTSAASRAFKGRCRAASIRHPDPASIKRRCFGKRAEAKDIPCARAAAMLRAAPRCDPKRYASSIAAFV
jgi:hypothetical protein